MNDATARRYRLFERERERRSQPTDLIFYSHDGVTVPFGYGVKGTIRKGWYGKRTIRPTQGGEVFEVRIAEYAEGPTSSSDLSSMFADTVSFLRFGSLYYQIKNVDNPVTATRVWTVTCEPTGQKSPGT